MTSPEETTKRSGPRRTKAASLVLLALLLLAAVTIVVTWARPPVHASEALISVESNAPVQPLELVPPAVPVETLDRYIASQVRMLRSTAVLHEVAKTPEIRATKWFQDHPTAGGAVEDLQADLSVYQVPDTNLISVSFSAKDAGNAAAIVRQVADTYLTQVQEGTRNEYRGRLKTHMDERNDLTALINLKLDQLRELISELPPGALSGAGGIVYEELAAYTQQAALLELQTEELESFATLHDDPRGPGFPAEDSQQVESLPEVVALENERLAAEREYEFALATTEENSEILHRLETRLEIVSRQLDELRERKLAEIGEFRRAQLRYDYLKAQNACLLAHEHVAKVEARQADADRRIVLYQTLLEEMELLRANQVRVSDFIRDLESVIAAPEPLPVRLVQEPMEPSTPDRQAEVRVTVVALAVPALFGLVVVLPRAFATRRSSAGDIA